MVEFFFSTYFSTFHRDLDCNNIIIDYFDLNVINNSLIN